MKSKILFNVLTCNRLHYLKNCVQSILDFIDLDRIKILICDNCTIEPGFEEYIQEVTSQYPNIIDVHIFKNRVNGELYRAMNEGIKYARKNDMPIINFIQDDFQFLYRNDKHLDESLSIYERHPKIVQWQFNMIWKTKFLVRKVRSNLLVVDGTNFKVLKRKSPCDNGFTRVDIYDRTGMYPEGLSFKKGDTKKPVGENWFANGCKRRGLKRAMSLFPNAALLFDAAFIRGSYRHGNYFPPPNRFYIHPFSEKEQLKIRENHDKEMFSFIEDTCKPDGWTPGILFKRDPNTTIVEKINKVSK